MTEVMTRIVRVIQDLDRDMKLFVQSQAKETGPDTSNRDQEDAAGGKEGKIVIPYEVEERGAYKLKSSKGPSNQHGPIQEDSKLIWTVD